MVKRKLTINKKAKKWQDLYPMVEVTWLDICSDSSIPGPLAQGLETLQSNKRP
jgi:hypothetical protein